MSIVEDIQSPVSLHHGKLKETDTSGTSLPTEHVHKCKASPLKPSPLEQTEVREAGTQESHHPCAEGQVLKG